MSGSVILDPTRLSQILAGPRVRIEADIQFFAGQLPMSTVGEIRHRVTSLSQQLDDLGADERAEIDQAPLAAAFAAKGWPISTLAEAADYIGQMSSVHQLCHDYALLASQLGSGLTVEAIRKRSAELSDRVGVLDEEEVELDELSLAAAYAEQGWDLSLLDGAALYIDSLDTVSRLQHDLLAVSGKLRGPLTIAEGDQTLRSLVQRIESLSDAQRALLDQAPVVATLHYNGWSGETIEEAVGNIASTDPISSLRHDFPVIALRLRSLTVEGVREQLSLLAGRLRDLSEEEQASFNQVPLSIAFEGKGWPVATVDEALDHINLMPRSSRFRHDLSVVAAQLNRLPLETMRERLSALAQQFAALSGAEQHSINWELLVTAFADMGWPGLTLHTAPAYIDSMPPAIRTRHNLRIASSKLQAPLSMGEIDQVVADLSRQMATLSSVELDAIDQAPLAAAFAEKGWPLSVPGRVSLYLDSMDPASRLRHDLPVIATGFQTASTSEVVARVRALSCRLKPLGWRQLLGLDLRPVLEVLFERGWLVQRPSCDPDLARTRLEQISALHGFYMSRIYPHVGKLSYEHCLELVGEYGAHLRLGVRHPDLVATILPRVCGTGGVHWAHFASSVGHRYVGWKMHVVALLHDGWTQDGWTESKSSRPLPLGGSFLPAEVSEEEREWWFEHLPAALLGPILSEETIPTPDQQAILFKSSKKLDQFIRRGSRLSGVWCELLKEAHRQSSYQVAERVREVLHHYAITRGDGRRKVVEEWSRILSNMGWFDCGQSVASALRWYDHEGREGVEVDLKALQEERASDLARVVDHKLQAFIEGLYRPIEGDMKFRILNRRIHSDPGSGASSSSSAGHQRRRSLG